MCVGLFEQDNYDLNILFGNTCKNLSEVACAVLASDKTGDREDHNNGMEIQSGFDWDLTALPLSVEIENVLDKYIDQLMYMQVGEFPTVEIEEKYEFVPIFKPQSGITSDINVSPAPTMPKHQTMCFKDQIEGYSADLETALDPTRMLQDKNDATLGDFLSRPQKIRDFEWGTGVSLNQSFNPWTDFLGMPRIANRICNYNLLRAHLRMKVVVNGNGFQYGRALMAYWPMQGYDQLSSHSGLVRADLVQTSQLPHIFLDPTTSAGGEMKIPFFWHENYFDIPNTSWTNAGQVLLRTINPLKHANGAVDKVTISVFVWAEDLELAMPTSQETGGLQPQSGKEIDEANSKGMISGPATTVAKVANMMSTFPPIAPFAMATSKVAGGVAAAAKIMGYSRPPNTSNPDPYRPTPISQLATTTTPDTAMKMTVDDKQELTIDPRISGVGASDPLTIREIAKRESYITSFPWGVGVAPESLLWNTRVNPVLWAETGLISGGKVLPACAIAALPFRYWTGGMRFRFQVVCSNFHKGRLEIRYDPKWVNPTTGDEYNVNYIEIVDIAETQDFTMEVGNAQELTLLKHLDPVDNSVTEGYSTTNYSGDLKGLCNGVLQVRVLNELTVPNSTIDNDIEINVFISMADDFEVFVPDDAFQKLTFTPQSGSEIVPDSQNTQEPSAPAQEEAQSIGGDIVYSADVNKVFAGESIVSFRPLLKRYNLWRREPNSIAGAGGKIQIYRRKSAYPFLRGDIPLGGAVDFSDSGPYNYVNTVLIHWITMCFAGWRGSIRYKYLYTKSGTCCYTTGGNDDIGSRVYIERLDPPEFGPPPYEYFENSINFVPASNPAVVFRRAVFGNGNKVPTGTRGTVFATDLINSNVEFEVPYQTQYRFVPGKLANHTTETVQWVNNYAVSYEGYTSDEQEIDMHVATGEDFQCYFWSGLPRVYAGDVPEATSG
jgi:hypothetical protein